MERRRQDIPHFIARDLRVSVIKHAHHDFDVDMPGKDSWTHRQSGATEVLVSSSPRWALMHELRLPSILKTYLQTPKPQPEKPYGTIDR
jgi:molybdopterin-guanine dinucleotide biosynthesis protein MobB